MTTSRAVSTAEARAFTDVVNRMRRALRRSIRTDFPSELRPVAHVELLQSLRETGPSRVRDLAERLFLAQSTVSSLIGQLITAGLVSREVDPDDRRAAVVTLTAAGRADLRGWDEAHRRRISAGLGALSAEDRAAVLAAVPALSRLVDAL